MISGRLASCIYKVSRNGSIEWTISGLGKAAGYGDFYVGEGANFAWQHDVRWVSETEISIFDNGNVRGGYTFPEPELTSRGLVLTLNTTSPGSYAVALKQELVNWAAPISKSSGNMQRLPNGNYWIGYGEVPLFAEFSHEGEVVSQYQISPRGSDVQSYRSYKKNFSTNPITIPDIAVQGNSLYLSWNGATEVRWWKILSGAHAGMKDVLGTVPKSGFETNFALPDFSGEAQTFLRADALDVDKKLLRSSNVIVKDSGRIVADHRGAQVHLIPAQSFGE